MFAFLLVLLLLLAAAIILGGKVIAPLRDALRAVPSRLRGALGVQEMADLQRLAAAEVTRRAMVSISARHLPNDILVLLNPDDHQRLRSLEHEFCGGVSTLLEAAVRNGDRDDGLPFRLLAAPRVRLKGDDRVARGTVSVVAAIAEETEWLGTRRSEPLLVLDLGDRQVPLQGELLVGRATYADIRIDATGVSREHAKLSCSGTTVLVEDLGGSNGTTVEDEPVDAGRARPGDRISFGPNASAVVMLSQRATDLADITTAPLRG